MEKKESKKCSRCKELKLLNEFHKDKHSKDEHTNWCKSCIKEYQVSRKEERKKWASQYYLENREKILKKEKKFRLENPEKYKQRQKESYLRNREKRLKKFKEYREKNPQQYNKMKRVWQWLYGKGGTHYGYLQGDGCCLYCGETNPFMLESHHPFGKKTHPDFTITLCANHHLPFKRFPKMLENWGEPIFE